MTNQTFILQLPKDLSVRFRFIPDGVNIAWSRKLRKRDIPNLELHYVPWRDDLLKRWAIERNQKIDFADLVMLELVNRM